MGISVSRLVLSGLVAGFTINLGDLAVNVWLLGSAWATALAGFGIELGLPALAWWGVGSFVVGIVGVWIYVAIRPRYAPGGATAWGLVEMALAVYVGAWLYREGELAAD